MGATVGTWVRIPEDEYQAAGSLYRCIMSIRLPYSSAEAVKVGLRAHAALNRDLETVSMEALPPLAGAHTGGALAPWTMIWTYRVNPVGGNVGVSQAGVINPWVITALVGFVIGGIAALALLSKRFERFVEVAADAFEEFGNETEDLLAALLPVAILGVVAFAITKKGG